MTVLLHLSKNNKAIWLTRFPFHFYQVQYSQYSSNANPKVTILYYERNAEEALRKASYALDWLEAK